MFNKLKKYFSRAISKEDVLDTLKNKVIEALKTIFDPEIPTNIYDLGLIYGVDITPDSNVAIQMTLTTPACPIAQHFPIMVESRVREVEGVADVFVEIVWDPPWTPEKMSEAARLELNMF